MSPFIITRALRVEQPFGAFYLVSLKARQLLDLSFSDSYREDENDLTGSQRAISIQRKKLICAYISSVDCAFPNSIILAANYTETGLLSDDDEDRWNVEGDDIDGYHLVIPKNVKLSAIVDGQHRLAGFEDSPDDLKDIELVCSIYIDLPPSLQAFLFATINLNQQPVSKNHAYGLFAYELSDGQPDRWSPDKVAISVSKELNKRSSFFEGRLKNAAINSEKFVRRGPDWNVSIAAIVDSILRLISKKPKYDRLNLRRAGTDVTLRSDLADDNSALREMYLRGYDEVLFDVIENCFSSLIQSYPSVHEGETCLTKTVGIQGVFEFLNTYILLARNKVSNSLEKVDLTKGKFDSLFSHIGLMDYTNVIFMASTAIGKRRIRDSLLIITGLKDTDDVTEDSELFELLDKTS